MGTTLQLSDGLYASPSREKVGPHAKDTTRAARVLGLVVAALGATVLFAWIADLDALKSPVPGLPVMAPNTALALLSIGLSLALLAGPEIAARRVGRALAALATLVAVVDLVDRLTVLDIGLHAMLSPDQARDELRPARNTIAAILSLGGALLTLDRPPRPWRIADILTIVAALIAASALLGYVYGATSLYQGPEVAFGVGMTVHTALAVLLAAFGLLFARPLAGPMQIVTSPFAGGAVARRLLFATLLIPAAGVVVQLGRRFHLFDPPVALALLTVTATFLSALATVGVARWLDRVDRAREQAAAAVRQLAILVESADDAIVGTDVDGVVESWNPAAERMFGYAAEEIVGKSVGSMVPPDLAEELNELGVRLRGGERIAGYETERLRRDGARVPLSLTISPIHGPDGTVVGFSTIARDVSERRAIEEALRRSEAQLRAMFLDAPDGMFVTDPEGVVLTDLSDAGCALLKASRQRLVGTPLEDIIAPEDRPRLESLRRRLRAGEVEKAQWRVRSRDGTLVPVDVSAKALPDGRWLGSVRDIRDRLAAEDALRRASEREARLRAELEQVLGASGAVSDALAELRDADLSIVLHTIALQAQRLTGAEMVAVGIGTDPDLPFEPWVTIGVSEEVARAIGRSPRPIGTFGRVARDGVTVRAREVREHPDFRGLPRHHPEVRSYLATPIRFGGRCVGSLYLANKHGRDAFDDADERCIRMIAARVGAAIEAAQVYAGETRQRAWTEAILEQMPEGVIVLDDRGRVAVRNQAAQRLARAKAGPAAPHDAMHYDLRRPDGAPVPEEELPLERALLRGESTNGVELAVVAPNDEWVPVLVSATPVRVGARTVGAVAVLQDIRALKELERLREEWAAVVAHDLRQPLNLLAMSSAALPYLHEGEMSADERHAIDKISGAVRSLDRMVRDLLDSSLIESRRLAIEPREVDLVRLVEDIVERACAVLADHPVEIVAAEPVRASVDAERIEQVLVNLLTNAAKYGARETPIRVALSAREHEAEVVVENHGPGVPEEELPLLFTRFTRTRDARGSGVAGVGLGLYIAKGLVEAHGGRIWAESVVGQTTAFHFTVPRVA